MSNLNKKSNVLKSRLGIFVILLLVILLSIWRFSVKDPNRTNHVNSQYLLQIVDYPTKIESPCQQLTFKFKLTNNSNQIIKFEDFKQNRLRLDIVFDNKYWPTYLDIDIIDKGEYCETFNSKVHKFTDIKPGESQIITITTGNPQGLYCEAIKDYVDVVNVFSSAIVNQQKNGQYAYQIALVDISNADYHPNLAISEPFTIDMQIFDKDKNLKNCVLGN